MIWTRRGFVRSLSTTALVLSLEDVLKLAVPAQAQTQGQTPVIGARPSYDAKPKPAPKGLPSPVTGTPLGFSFMDVAKSSGLNAKTIYGGEHKNRFLLETTGCGVAFYDFDHDDWIDLFLGYGKDGHLDLFVANYIDFDIKTAPLPEAAGCAYKGMQVACGPPGLDGGKNILYHNNGDGTFTDVSVKSGMENTIGTYGLSVVVADLDNDGWPDIYVAKYCTAATFYQNQKDGTFTDLAIEAGLPYSPPGNRQPRIVVAVCHVH